MIDPYVFDKNGEFLLFFKQNGVSVSKSADLNENEKGSIGVVNQYND